MAADRRYASGTRSPSASEQTIDADDREFLAACLAAISGKPVQGLHDAMVRPDEDARREANPRAMASVAPNTSKTRPPGPNPAEMVDTNKVIRRLKAHIEELREALTESRAQIKASSETLRENEALRQSLAHSREQRSADAKALEDFLTHHESDARSEVETLHQVLSAMTADRDTGISDLKEARRREAQIRAELQTLREELTNVNMRYDDTTTALEAAIQRGNQARAELATAMTAISDHDSAVEQLRQIITERDQQIDELRQHLLKAEEARVADAAAFLDSLNEHRS